MILILETDGHHMERRRRLLGARDIAAQPAGDLNEIRLRGPSMPALPPFAGLPVIHEPGTQRMELVVNREGSLLQVSAGLTISR